MILNIIFYISHFLLLFIIVDLLITCAWLLVCEDRSRLGQELCNAIPKTRVNCSKPLEIFTWTVHRKSTYCLKIVMINHENKMNQKFWGLHSNLLIWEVCICLPFWGFQWKNLIVSSSKLIKKFKKNIKDVSSFSKIISSLKMSL